MRRFFSWVTPALVVGLLSGSLAGSVFTWWVNREPPLTIGYVVSSTSTGTDATTKSLVPGLALRIDARDIPAIHTHVISLSRTSGYADRVEVAVTFSQPVQVFGNAFDAPSPLHTISCQPLANGHKCALGPMDGQGEYRLSLATDSASAPRLMVVGRNTRLASLADIASRNSWRDLLASDAFSLALWTATVVGLLFTAFSLLTGRAASRDTHAFAESVMAYAEERLRQPGQSVVLPPIPPEAGHPLLEVGTKVRHAQFGRGTVKNLEKVDGEWKVTVDFPSVGVKKLLDKFAKLEVELE